MLHETICLTFLLSDLAANMIGRSNARRGARRIFAVLQNRRLNQHLVYTIVDEVSHSYNLLYVFSKRSSTLHRYSLPCFLIPVRLLHGWIRDPVVVLRRIYTLI